MIKEIRQGIPPIRKAIKANIMQELPKRGGLNVWVAKSRITAKIRRGSSSAGIAVKVGRNSAGGRSDLRRIDDGRVRHLTWGHRPWHSQTVNPNSITGGVTDEGTDQLHQAVLAAADKAAGVIVNG
jgi:hypothetical protein